MEMTDKYMTDLELAEYLGIGVATLRRMRRDGAGPPWHRVADRLVRYRRSEVEDWLQSREGAPVGGA